MVVVEAVGSHLLLVAAVGAVVALSSPSKSRCFGVLLGEVDATRFLRLGSCFSVLACHVVVCEAST